MALSRREYESNAAVWRALGWAYGELGRPADGLIALDRARALVPTSDLTLRMELLVERNILAQRVNSAAILAHMDAARQTTPEALYQLRERLSLLLALERFEDALLVVRDLTRHPEARPAHWVGAVAAYLLMPDVPAAYEVRAAVDAAHHRSPDDVAVSAAYRDLRRPVFDEDQLPPRLRALGFASAECGGNAVVLPPLCGVPAGEFMMGSDPAQDSQASADEYPQHLVELVAYQIMRYPVTVAEYACFVRAGHRAPSCWRAQATQPDRPVRFVTRRDAAAYASWLADLTGERWRLPSEAEWEKAARWNPATRRAATFPWGDTFDSRRCNVAAPGDDLLLSDLVVPIGMYPAGRSWYGVHEMSGNLWEWTSSRYTPYPSQPKPSDHDSEGDVSKPTDVHVVRGGAWHHDARFARAACRGHRSPVDYGPEIGFRLVRELERG